MGEVAGLHRLAVERKVLNPSRLDVELGTEVAGAAVARIDELCLPGSGNAALPRRHKSIGVDDLPALDDDADMLTVVVARRPGRRAAEWTAFECTLKKGCELALESCDEG